jgi:3-oxoacyl-[acyl-carrier-protein] synthase-1
MPGVIVSSSVLCSAGSGPEQLWASVRAGISRIANSGVLDGHLEGVSMGLVPEDALEPQLPPEIASLPLPARARRMLRLAAPALRPVLESVTQRPIRLYLGLPELTATEAPWIRSFALQLGKLAGAPIDAPNSRVVPAGRAAALIALELALEALERDPEHPVVVGGVDTYYDFGLLSSLDADKRILGSHVMDGFIPGEGAGFLVISHPTAVDAGSGSAPAGKRPAVTVLGAASARDPGHRGGTEPARGEGLAEAINTLRSRSTGSTTPVATTFAGLNGESFDAKLWGVARVRHADFISASMLLQHPADCIGDTGAASGAILLGVAAEALATGTRPGPALVWAASDGESRGCALMSVSSG